MLRVPNPPIPFPTSHFCISLSWFGNSHHFDFTRFEGSGTAPSLSSWLQILYPHHSLLFASYPFPVESAKPSSDFFFLQLQFFSPFLILSARFFTNCWIKLQVVQGKGCVFTYCGPSACSEEVGAHYSDVLWHMRGASPERLLEILYQIWVLLRASAVFVC